MSRAADRQKLRNSLDRPQDNRLDCSHEALGSKLKNLRLELDGRLGPELHKRQISKMTGNTSGRFDVCLNKNRRRSVLIFSLITAQSVSSSNVDSSMV